MNEEFYFGDVVALIGCSEKYIVNSVNDLGEVYLEKVSNKLNCVWDAWDSVKQEDICKYVKLGKWDFVRDREYDYGEETSA